MVRLKKNDLPVRYIHAHLVAVFATGILMWSYAFVALFTIDHPMPGIVGIAASTIHLLSPMLYWRNNNYFANSNVFIAAGMAHQLTYTYFTGGFDSNILIWLGILPMLSGVVAGRRGAILWAFITGVSVSAFLLLKLSGYECPVLISSTGKLLTQALILFGWIFISSLVIWVHVLLVEQNAEMLETSRQRIQNLVNVLSHDISTPLSVIVVKLHQLLKTPLSNEQQLALAKANKAAERVVQITESIKELRLTEMGKKEITFSEVVVRDLIGELKEIFAEKLEQKNLKLNWSVSSDIYSFHSSRSLMINQILGNLLSNSVKFSQKNSEIRMRVSKVNQSIQFVIEDSGVGIPRDMREHLFEANLSRSSLGTDGEVGTGFGLPIVKSCVERLGGKISFETQTSHEGPSGTKFKLIFALA